MSKERLGEAIRAIKSNWPDERYSLLRDALNYVISEAELAKDLEKLREEDSTYYNELLTDVREQNKRYREAMDYTKLKLRDFRKDANTIRKLSRDRIVQREAFNLSYDIRNCLEALESESHE